MLNAASPSTVEPPPVLSSGGALLDQDGIAGTRERLAEIDERRRALTALNDQEFATHPARLRANQITREYPVHIVLIGALAGVAVGAGLRIWRANRES